MHICIYYINVLNLKPFKYLGCITSKDATTQKDLYNRLGQMRRCIKQLNLVLWNGHITKHTKKNTQDDDREYNNIWCRNTGTK